MRDWKRLGGWVVCLGFILGLAVPGLAATRHVRMIIPGCMT